MKVPGADGLAGNQLWGQLLEAGDVGQRRPGTDEERWHPAGRGRLLPLPDQQVLLPSRQRHMLRERRQTGHEPRFEVGVVRRQEELLRVPPLHLLVVGATQPGGMLAGLGDEPARTDDS
jgi:hypothetical protein